MDIIDNKLSYNDIAGEWHRYRLLKPINRCIVEVTGLLPTRARIMDIGCGSGYPIDDYFDKAGFIVTAIDEAEEMIAIAKTLSLSNVHFILSDIRRYTDDNQYDLIIAFDVLWHLDIKDQEDLFWKIGRWLKPGGYFFFTHGFNESTLTGEMFNRPFSYCSPGYERIVLMLESLNMAVINEWFEYHEESTGYRELMVLARKDSL